MPPAEDIQRYLFGVWRMMTGRPDGLRMLDLSVDGFWNSFSAIVVALPAMLAGWVPMANDAFGPDVPFAARLAHVVRLAIIDLGSWVIPLAIFVTVSGYVGLKDRVIPYVVASNWASALLIWFLLPVSVIDLFWPGARDATSVLALVIFLVTLVLFWRLTNVAIAKGPAMASAVFAGMFFASLLVLFALQELLGVPPL
ncbi:hypothetical protein [Aquamicrobium sp. LC103]|uniref:hypothetical protein n=1 Tax=Aquamicrobium sp. LC103 TaxID=1120658 RepID=UPI00063E8ACE|nr:hypothetical protein [Aquamicrobium sp. LC103]TKT74999.1 transporter [Aquamicrobium sp. LC103]